MITVGLLDAQSVHALIFAKQLRKNGHHVVLFFSTKLSRVFYSRFADKKVICPSTQNQTQEFHDFFLDYLAHNSLDVVVPLNDSSAKYLSKFKSELTGKVRFSIPDYPVFMRGYDKNQFMQLCEDHGLPHPRTLDLNVLKSDMEIPDFKFPALIKPNETSGAQGFKMVNDLNELWANYDSVRKEYGDCHLQEFIPHQGKQYKVELLIKDSKIVYSTVIEKIRFFPVTGGSSCYNISIVNEELVDICTKALRHLNWEGFADFDLIEDKRDGVIKFMELNPRTPNCLKASVISGIDFPNAIVNLSLNKKLAEYKYIPGKFLRFFAIDLLWLFSSENKWTAFKKWRLQLFSSNHFLEDGDYRDPLPLFMGLFFGLFKLVKTKKT